MIVKSPERTLALFNIDKKFFQELVIIAVFLDRVKEGHHFTTWENTAFHRFGAFYGKSMDFRDGIHSVWGDIDKPL